MKQVAGQVLRVLIPIVVPITFVRALGAVPIKAE